MVPKLHTRFQTCVGFKFLIRTGFDPEFASPRQLRQTWRVVSSAFTIEDLWFS